MADIPNARQDADLSPMDELESAMAEARAPVGPQPAPAPVSEDTDALFRLSAQLSAMVPEASPPAPTHPPHSDAPAPLADEDGLTDDAFAEGIAAIFRGLADAVADAEDRPAEAVHLDEPAEASEEPTFALLGELDRLWHRAAH